MEKQLCLLTEDVEKMCTFSDPLTKEFLSTAPKNCVNADASSVYTVYRVLCSAVGAFSLRASQVIDYYTISDPVAVALLMGMFALEWRYNGCDGVLNHQPHDCLLNR